MPTTPDLAEVILDALDARAQDVMTATVGHVHAYYPATPTSNDTVDVELPIMRPINEQGETTYAALPVLPGLPIAWPQGGGHVMTFPLKKGDPVLVIFTHESIMMWREVASQCVPGDLQRHSLGNGVVIPGIRPTSKSVFTGDPTHVAARAAGLYIGKEGADQVLEFSDTGIGIGHLAVDPVARAPGVLTALAALLTWANAVQAALAGGGATVPAAGLLAPATTALDTALGAGLPATVASLLAKVK